MFMQIAYYRCCIAWQPTTPALKMSDIPKNEILEQRITHFDTVLMEKLKYIAEIEWHLQQVNIDNEQS